MTDYTEDVLRRLQDLLVLAPAENGLQQSTILTHDDQLFIFETAGLLITSGNFDADVCSSPSFFFLLKKNSHFTYLPRRVFDHVDLFAKDSILVSPYSYYILSTIVPLLTLLTGQLRILYVTQYF